MSSPVASTSTLPIALLLPPLRLIPKWLRNWSTNGIPIVVTGYQLYAVSQRVTDRNATLPYIVVFSGDPNDSVVVERWVVSSSTAEPARVQETAKSMLREMARLNETDQGLIPVTALPSLSTTLSIVRLPSGTYQAHFKQLCINITLRRLGLGGRSGLNLSEPSQAQQLQFRQSYQLPIPSISPLAPSTLTFTDTVLEVVRLVQNALSLFGLGVVRVRTGSSQGNDSNETEFELLDGDGLLCDSTLAALELFRLDIGESFLRLPPNESVLPPPLLAGLLSLIIATRGKLNALGVNDLPKDPFERRVKFLSACQAYQRSQNITPISAYLSPVLLSTISAQFARSTAQSSTSKVSRALRTRLDASLPFVDSSSSSNKEKAIKGGSKKLRGAYAETSNLEQLVDELESSRVGGATLSQLYGIEASSAKARREDWIDSEATEATTSDNESHSFPMNVISGVRARAGRAGRMIGDNLGFGGDNSLSSPQSPDYLAVPGKRAAPSVIISSDLEDIYDREVDLSTTMSRTSSRISTATLSISDASPPSSGLLPAASVFLNPSAATSSVLLGLGAPPGSLRRGGAARRSASERPGSIVGHAALLALGVEDGVSTSSGSAWIMEKADRPIRRRHSFHIVSSADEPFQLLSRKRLGMDVQLRMTAWNLRQRELKLIELGDALQIISNSYSQALLSLSTPLATRADLLAALTSTALALSTRVESQSAHTSLLAEMSTGSSRIVYSQSVLEDKLADVLEFRRLLESKVGIEEKDDGSARSEGTLRIGVRELQKRQSGMRRLVGSLEAWATWTRFLIERAKMHLGLAVAGSDDHAKSEEVARAADGLADAAMQE